MTAPKPKVDAPVEEAPAPAPEPAPVVTPPAPSGPNAVQRLLLRLQTLATNYVTHIAGQAITWITLATHDASKWEAAISTLATAVGTGLLKKISAKIKAWGA